MGKTALAIALACTMPACTMLGVVVGRSVATSNNEDREVAIARGQKPPPEVPLKRTIIACAVVGFMFDAIMVYAAVESLEHFEIQLP